MQATMDRLERFVSRRRRVVLGLWLALLIVSAPLAARQTSSLTGGGFEVPGSESKAVSDALAGIPGTQSETLAIVFDNRRGDPQALAAAVDKVKSEGFKDVEGVRATPEALDAARNATEPIHVMPLVVTATRDDASTRRPRSASTSTSARRARRCRCTSSARAALWAGMQELSKKDLEQAEFVGLPLVLLILLAVFGSLAAAALPLALGVAAVIGHRRDRLPARAGDGDVDLRHQHGLDAGHRRGGRLLAVHPRPLPRGAARRPLARRGARGRDAHVGDGGRVLRRDRGRRARRAVPDQRQGRATRWRSARSSSSRSRCSPP